MRLYFVHNLAKPRVGVKKGERERVNCRSIENANKFVVSVLFRMRTGFYTDRVEMTGGKGLLQSLNQRKMEKQGTDAVGYTFSDLK